MCHHLISKQNCLYFSHSDSTGIRQHAHAHFQLEYCIQGQIHASTSGKKLLLRSGDLWVIPPGMVHRFEKNKEKLDFISIKFNADHRIGSRIENDLSCRYCLEQIRAVLDGETPFNAYSREGKSIIENYLSCILQHLGRSGDPLCQSRFKTDLQSLICELAAASNVNDLAEQFEMSRAEFKYRFQTEFGNGRIKEYIDSVLLKIIEQHLLYSDFPLGNIAEQLHFSSIYAFSRYYKHHKKITPSEFRRRRKLYR